MSIPHYTRDAAFAEVAKGKPIRAVMTNEARNRKGNVVRMDGMDTAAFDRNPVVLWAHDGSRPPIGTVSKLIREPNRLVAEVDFAKTDEGRQAEKLYRDGILRAWSVGYRILEATEMQDGAGLDIAKSELLELSAVTIPANPEALSMQDAIVPSPAWVADHFASFKEGTIMENQQGHNGVATGAEGVPAITEDQARGFFAKLFSLFTSGQKDGAQYQAEPDTSGAPKPATVEELKDAFAGDHEYCLDCLGRGLTLDQAKVAYTSRLQGHLKDATAKVAALEQQVKAQQDQIAGINTQLLDGAAPAKTDTGGGDAPVNEEQLNAKIASYAKEHKCSYADAAEVIFDKLGVDLDLTGGITHA